MLKADKCNWREDMKCKVNLTVNKTLSSVDPVALISCSPLSLLVWGQSLSDPVTSHPVDQAYFTGL